MRVDACFMLGKEERYNDDAMALSGVPFSKVKLTELTMCHLDINPLFL